MFHLTYPFQLLLSFLYRGHALMSIAPLEHFQDLTNFGTSIF